MFAKDVELLNNLYNKQIVTEMNIGPHGDQDPGAGLSTITPVAVDITSSEEDYDESNTDMAKQSLYRLVKLAAMLHDLICKETNVEPWLFAKITEALHNIESAYGHKDYEQFKTKVEHDISNISEETETDLYNTISSGGVMILSKIRHILASESRENLESFLYETINALETKKH